LPAAEPPVPAGDPPTPPLPPALDATLPELDELDDAEPPEPNSSNGNAREHPLAQRAAKTAGALHARAAPTFIVGDDNRSGRASPVSHAAWSGLGFQGGDCG
jgi:hypothetical protein